MMRRKNLARQPSLGRWLFKLALVAAAGWSVVFAILFLV
jgi:hypothetical protein